MSSKNEGVESLQQALASHPKHYEIKEVGPNSYSLECGNAALCGCMGVGGGHYAFDVEIQEEDVLVTSTVGQGNKKKMDQEAAAIKECLKRALNDDIIAYQETPEKAMEISDEGNNVEEAPADEEEEPEEMVA